MHALPESDLRKHLPRNVLAETGAWRSPAVILCVTVILAVVLKPLLAPQLTPALVFVLGTTLIGANSVLIPGLITSILAAPRQRPGAGSLLKYSNTKPASAPI